MMNFQRKANYSVRAPSGPRGPQSTGGRHRVLRWRQERGCYSGSFWWKSLIFLNQSAKIHQQHLVAISSARSRNKLYTCRLKLDFFIDFGLSIGASLIERTH